MARSTTVNRQWVLAERPRGEPDDRTLRLVTGALPTAGKGRMLLRNEYLSLDPYMRGRMSDRPSYAPPVELGAVMVGGTVAEVLESDVDGFAPGDWVVAAGGWQDYALSDGTGVVNLGRNPENPSWTLGVLGMPGLRLGGLTEIGRPKAGETLDRGKPPAAGRRHGRPGRVLGCRVSASPAAPKNAPTWSMPWASMPASTIGPTASPMP